MFALTAREQALLAAVLCAAVLGAAVKHWRDARREGRSAAASPVPAATHQRGAAAAPVVAGR